MVAKWYCLLICISLGFCASEYFYVSAFCRSLFCAFCTCPLITGACNYLFCANVGWPLVRLLNFYERLSAILCSYNIHLLWLHLRATQRVYNFWVLARDSYLTSALPLWNFVQSPVVMVWRMCSSSIPQNCIHSFMDQDGPSEIYIPRPLHVHFPLPLLSSPTQMSSSSDA